jgi:transcriptional regulator with XRE-family HTH domain
MAENNFTTSYLTKSHWRKRLAKLMANDHSEGALGEVSVGKRLQALRMEMGLSQRALAEMSGLNFNTLSLIENEKTSPNVSTLQQLASALNVPITTFFESIKEVDQVVFQKAGERQKTIFSQGQIEDLGGGMALGEGTPLLLIFNPHEVSDLDPISHSGQEFVYCLEGDLIFTVGDEQHHLEEGDSLIFDAQIPHRWENQSDESARAILVICPSDVNDRSVVQHLPNPS